VPERTLRLLWNINLSLLKALDQVVWRDVDELDGVGAIEDRVRHGFPHANAGNLRDHVVRAFDVLNV
jgi:hypothetical protein